MHNMRWNKAFKQIVLYMPHHQTPLTTRLFFIQKSAMQFIPKIFRYWKNNH